MDKLAVWIIVALMIPINAVAIGVVPASHESQYSPGQDFLGQITIINNDDLDQEVTVFAVGKLAGQISFSESHFTMKSGEKKHAVSFTLSQPNELGEHGRVGTDIIVKASPLTGKDSSGVYASTAVVSTVVINVPFPEAYLGLRLFVPSFAQGKESGFGVEITNLGQDDAVAIDAVIEVKNPFGEPVASLPVKTGTIKPGQKKLFAANWNPDVPNGEYTAVLTVKYSGKTFSAERPVKVGSSGIALDSIKLERYVPGEIAKVDIEVENLWNRPAENVYIKGALHDEAKTLRPYQSEAYTIKPYSRQGYSLFFDVSGLQERSYALDVIVLSEESEQRFGYDFAVSRENAFILQKGQQLERPAGTAGITVLQIVALMLVAAVALLLISLWRRKSGKEK